MRPGRSKCRKVFHGPGNRKRAGIGRWLIHGITGPCLGPALRIVRSGARNTARASNMCDARNGVPGCVLVGCVVTSCGVRKVEAASGLLRIVYPVRGRPRKKNLGAGPIPYPWRDSHAPSDPAIAWMRGERGDTRKALLRDGNPAKRIGCAKLRESHYDGGSGIATVVSRQAHRAPKPAICRQARDCAGTCRASCEPVNCRWPVGPPRSSCRGYARLTHSWRPGIAG